MSRASRRGRPPHPDVLTPAEWRVVDAVRHGMSNRTIARWRGISLDAVKFHVENAIGKLGLANRSELRQWRGAPIDSALRATADKGTNEMHGKDTPSTEAASTRAASVSTDAASANVAPANATSTGATPRSDRPLGRVGQISREVKDLERAVEWYRDTLGLPLLGSYGNLATFDMDGVRLFISHHEDGNTSGNSIIYFYVSDIDAAYEDLTSRGIRFRGAPHMIHRHPDGMEEWMAFFDDLDGELLAIMSQVTP
jgi:DNA-binding CsgD family transcriptional regulator/catechol 2,3-dioxygenase-like lactoylglutathione lyase family enzyme